jgi:hypothetical protein
MIGGGLILLKIIVNYMVCANLIAFVVIYFIVFLGMKMRKLKRR